MRVCSEKGRRLWRTLSAAERRQSDGICAIAAKRRLAVHCRSLAAAIFSVRDALAFVCRRRFRRRFRTSSSSSSSVDSDNYDALLKTAVVGGIIVTYEEDVADIVFSPDDRNVGGSQYAWNPAVRLALARSLSCRRSVALSNRASSFVFKGSQPGFMFHAFEMPLFICRNVNISTTLIENARDNEARALAYPQWGANLNAFMDAAPDAAT